MKPFYLFLTLLLAPALGLAATIYVPDNYGTIQEAINGATKGDTIIVRPGTFVENIDFIGKAVAVRSEKGPDLTVIDGNQSGSVVSFKNGEGSGAVLDGFTLTNGTGTKHTVYKYLYGGGIYLINNASPRILNNRITGNNAYNGAGMFGDYAAPEITNNVVSGNHAANEGGAMLFAYSTDLIIDRNVVMGNSAQSWGGGIEVAQYTSVTVTNNIVFQNVAQNKGSGGILLARYCTGTITNNLVCGNRVTSFGAGIDVFFNSQAELANNTIFNNTAGSGGGISCRENSSLIIRDTLLWNNKAAQGKEIFINASFAPSSVSISYSDLEGGQASVEVSSNCTLNWGSGMIDKDPLFAPGPCGFHYLSQVAAGQPADSPCVDAGSGPASNAGMDTLWTRTDGAFDSGTVDLGFHYGPFPFPGLQGDVHEISESAGGQVSFLLLGGTDHAGRSYILLGSLSGTSPGTPLPGGTATLPLNWDIFTTVVTLYANSPVLPDFMGSLDNEGSASAAMIVQPFFGGAGSVMHFAYALNKPWNFASNPVEVRIVP